MKYVLVASKANPLPLKCVSSSLKIYFIYELAEKETHNAHNVKSVNYTTHSYPSSLKQLHSR